jgi:hypothetical protein
MKRKNDKNYKNYSLEITLRSCILYPDPNFPYKILLHFCCQVMYTGHWQRSRSQYFADPLTQHLLRTVQFQSQSSSVRTIYALRMLARHYLLSATPAVHLSYIPPHALLEYRTPC